MDNCNFCNSHYSFSHFHFGNNCGRKSEFPIFPSLAVAEIFSVTLDIDYFQNGNSRNNAEQFSLFILGFCMIKNLLYVV